MRNAGPFVPAGATGCNSPWAHRPESKSNAVCKPFVVSKFSEIHHHPRPVGQPDLARPNCHFLELTLVRKSRRGKWMKRIRLVIDGIQNCGGPVTEGIRLQEMLSSETFD
jgi:hypothetical protein